mgnify:FL=1
MTYKYPQIIDKLKQLKMTEDSNLTSLTIFQNTTITWFQSMFTVNVPCDLSHRIFDLFFLNGDMTLFHVWYAIMSLLKEQILNCPSIENL